MELVTGDDAAVALDDALERVAGSLSYLRGHAGRTEVARPSDADAPRDGDFVSCSDLVEDHSFLSRVIDVEADGLRTDDRSVAASIFVQDYAYRVMTMAVGCATWAGVVPDSAASHVAIGLRRNRPSVVAYCEPRALLVPAPRWPPKSPGQVPVPEESEAVLRFLVERAVEANLRQLVESTRRAVRIGERLLWGNIASSSAMAFRTAEGILGEWVRNLGERFFELAPGEMRDLGSFLALEVGERRGWFWERTNCCLYYRLPKGIRCSDCSLVPVEERRAAYRESLGSDPLSASGSSGP